MCRCNPLSRVPFCGRPGCEWPEQLKNDLQDASDQAYEANEQLAKALKADPDMFDKVDALMKEHADIQTPIITADKKLLVLYSKEKFQQDEIESLSSLTEKELLVLLKVRNFKSYDV